MKMTPATNGNGRIKIAERLARIETRLDSIESNAAERKDETKAILVAVQKIQLDLAGWKGKVAGIAATVSFLISIGAVLASILL